MLCKRKYCNEAESRIKRGYCSIHCWEMAGEEEEIERLEKENANLKEAIKALADLWAGTEKHRWESLESESSDELKEVLIMKWPQVQGTANNFLLKRVAALPFDSTKLIPVLKQIKEESKG